MPKRCPEYVTFLGIGSFVSYQCIKNEGHKYRHEINRHLGKVFWGAIEIQGKVTEK